LQRQRIQPELLNKLPPRLHDSVRRLLALLRIGLAMGRARSDRIMIDFGLSADNDTLRLALPSGWLQAHPLTRQDLEVEQLQLARLDISLALEALDQSPLA